MLPQVGDIVADCEGTWVSVTNYEEHDVFNSPACGMVEMADLSIIGAFNCSVTSDQEGITDPALLAEVSATMDQIGTAITDFVKEYVKGTFVEGSFNGVQYVNNGGLGMVIVSFTAPIREDSTRHMTPGPSGLDGRDRTLGDSVVVGDGLLGLTRIKAFDNLPDVVIGQVRCPLLLTPHDGPLVDLVLASVDSRTRPPDVPRVHALPVLPTGVCRLHPRRARTVRQFARHDVSTTSVATQAVAATVH